MRGSIDSELIHSFSLQFSGEVISPNDVGYAAVSSVFTTVGSPALIVRPTNSADIVTAIRFAREHSLQLSVRSGGHSGAGFGTNTDGMVIDLKELDRIEVIDESSHIVRIGSGAMWEKVAATLQTHGLAISSGDTKTVGVGGLTLGGGIGWLVRVVGLTIDCLVAAEVVTAQGEILRASSTENTDLFWAIRGGGGNFGIVTSFEFSAYPIGKVYAGMLQYGVEDVYALLTGWRDTMRNASDKLNSTLLLMPSFGGNPAGVIISCCYASDNETEAVQAIAPLEKLGTLLQKNMALKNYSELLETAHLPTGIEIISKNRFVDELSTALIDTIVNLCESAIPVLQIRSLGGAMKRVSSDATAFSNRHSEVLMVSPSFIPVGATSEVRAQSLQPWKKLSTFEQGVYGNLLSTNSPEDVMAIYPEKTYARLSLIKRQYDPENIFRGNYNILPSTT